MTLSRLELIAGAGLLLLLAVAVLRIATPGQPPRAAVSIEGIAIDRAAVQTGETLVREAEWRPRVDVYVLGWSSSASAVSPGLDLQLRHEQTVLFHGPSGGASTANPAFLPPGSGYRLSAGEALTFQLRFTNTGPPGQTPEAKALVYFVPVED